MPTRPHIPSEEELLAEARQVIEPLPPVEPRAGFAAMVALNARDRLVSPFARWLRWSLGGLALAGAAAVAVAVVAPARRPPVHDVMVAQRLDLFEDLTVVQNQEALEDLEVVEVLHQLQPEARP